MSNVFVIAQTANGAAEACAAARSFGGEVTLCVVGGQVVTGVADKCLHVEVPAGNIADDAYPAVVSACVQSGATVVVAEQTMATLSIVGRVAAANKAAAICGVTSFDGDAASSMYYGGAGIRTAQPVGDFAVYVISAGAFDASAATGADVVEELAFEAPVNAVAKVASEPVPASDVNLHAADVVVSCGRGFAEKEELQLAYDLAAKLGGECGCSRPLAEGVDWFPREAYIGVSGVMLAPRAAICVGVSGQAQHMIGLTSAETLIAVNKDKNAPVFKQCDYGFVGDLKEVLPALTAAL